MHSYAVMIRQFFQANISHQVLFDVVGQSKRCQGMRYYDNRMQSRAATSINMRPERIVATSRGSLIKFSLTEWNLIMIRSDDGVEPHSDRSGQLFDTG